MWEFAKVRGPDIDPTKEGSHYKDTQKKGHRISRNSCVLHTLPSCTSDGAVSGLCWTIIETTTLRAQSAKVWRIGFLYRLPPMLWIVELY